MVTKSGNLILIQYYYLILRPFSSVPNCPVVKFMAFFFLDQDPFYSYISLIFILHSSESGPQSFFVLHDIDVFEEYRPVFWLTLPPSHCRLTSNVAVRIWS